MLVGLYGKAGAGKTTIAHAVTNSVIAFAKPIKYIAERCFGWDGKKDERGRRLLQVLGTEAGREYNPNIWIDYTITAYKLSSSNLVVIDDVRFQNEADAIIKESGIVLEVIGRGTDLGSNASHVSEQGISMPFLQIDNSGTVEESVRQFWEIVNASIRSEEKK